MTLGCRSSRGVPRPRAALACLLALLAGCQTVKVPDNVLDQPVAPALAPPRELCKVSLPTYRIEPPDVINIEMPRLVPLPPYRAEVYDVLTIHVSNALSDQPIDNYFRVEAEGVVNLGPAYGSVRVVGMTLDECKRAIEGKPARWSASRRSPCNWPRSSGRRRSPANTGSDPTARSTCGSTAWSTWRD